MKQQHKEDMQEKEEEYEQLKDLSDHKVNSLKKEMDELQDKHKSEITNLILMLLTQKRENKTKLKRIQLSHRKEEDWLKKQLSRENNKEEEEKVGKLKKTHKQEMEGLKRAFVNQNKEDRKTGRKELLIKHEEEMTELKKTLLKKQNNRRKKLMNYTSNRTKSWRNSDKIS